MRKETSSSRFPSIIGILGLFAVLIGPGLLVATIMVGHGHRWNIPWEGHLRRRGEQEVLLDTSLGPGSCSSGCSDMIQRDFG